MAQPELDIDVIVQAGDWPAVDLRPAIEAALSVLDQPRRGELSVALTDDVHIQRLNRDYRKKDKPTNVLSFSQEGALLGDIVLALETLVREADEKNVTFNAHLSHLVIHGFLHLQGYDHVIEAEAEEMEALEIRALALLGIDNPYEISER